MEIKHIDIKNLSVSTTNVRKNEIDFMEDEESNISSLASDIKQRGLINPISVI